MPNYLLNIDTDGDFGLKIKFHYLSSTEEKSFYGEEIKIKVKDFDRLKSVVNNMEVIQTNPGKTQFGRQLIKELQTMVNNGNEYGHSNGNRWFVYEPIKYDLIV